MASAAETYLERIWRTLRYIHGDVVAGDADYASSDVKHLVIDHAATDNTLVPAVAGKKIRILEMCIIAAGAVNVRFESGISGPALTGQMNLAANGGFMAQWNPRGHFETGVGQLLNMELSGSVSVDGWAKYIEVS